MFRRMSKFVGIVFLIAVCSACSSYRPSSGSSAERPAVSTKVEIPWAVGEPYPSGLGERSTLASVDEESISVAARSNVGWYTLNLKVQPGSVIQLGKKTYTIVSLHPNTNHVVIRDVTK